MRLKKTKITEIALGGDLDRCCPTLKKKGGNILERSGTTTTTSRWARDCARVESDLGREKPSQDVGGLHLSPSLLFFSRHSLR